MSMESVMPSNHLILCHPLLLLPSIFPSIRVSSVIPFSSWDSLVVQRVKRLPTMQETRVQSPGLEEEVATHSSTLSWKIPWMEKPGAGYSPWVTKSRTWLSDFTVFHSPSPPRFAWVKFLNVPLVQNLAIIKQKSSPDCYRKCNCGEGLRPLILILLPLILILILGSATPSPGAAVVVSVGWLPWVSPFCPWGHRAMVREQLPLSLERCYRNHPRGVATALQGGTEGSLGWYLLPASSSQHVLDICHGLGMVRD